MLTDVSAPFTVRFTGAGPRPAEHQAAGVAGPAVMLYGLAPRQARAALGLAREAQA